jgi:hypothetical protein
MAARSFMASRLCDRLNEGTMMIRRCLFQVLPILAATFLRLSG